MIWFFVVGAVIIFIVMKVVSSDNKYVSDDLLTGPTEDEDREKFLKMDLPNFNYDEPIKCLLYINEIPQRYVKNAMYNLEIDGRVNNRIYLQAFNEKDSKGSIDLQKYLDKFKIFERGNFRIEINDVVGYEFYDILNVAGVHLDYRKSYIVDKISEGDAVILIPEPENEFDNNAIQVVHNNFPFGYIPAINCKSVRELMAKDYKVFIYDLVYQVDGFVDVEIILYEKK